MVSVKLVSEQDFEVISKAINDGEGFPLPPESLYQCDTWLDKSSCFDSVHGYYIPQDEITEKYTSGFAEVQLTVQNADII